MKKVLKNIGKTALFRCIFPLLYTWYSRKPVQKNRVLFLEIRYAGLTNNFTLLYEEFCKKETFTVDVSFLGNSVFSYKDYIKSCFEMLKPLAVSEYVFVDESSNVLAALPIRKETKLIQTWHGCGAFKRFGYEGTANLKEKYYNAYTFTTVSSPAVVDIYAKSMGQDRKSVLPIGVSRTDVFFRQEYIDSCKKQIRSSYGIGEEQQIILYAPTFRGNVQEARSPKLPDWQKMYQNLGKQYVILYKAHPAVKALPEIPDACVDFFYDASKEEIESLMCASDLCITDYSSLIFEYSLLKKPMYFYAYDYKDYVTERGFYYTYDEFVPGSIYYNEEELIKGILEEKEDSLQKVVEFRERFMSACDGHATSRIIEKVLNE